MDKEVPQDLRESRALKVGELVERSGVSHDTFTMVEGGHRTAKPRRGAGWRERSAWSRASWCRTGAIDDGRWPCACETIG